MDNLPERAYRILELLAADSNLTQRALAQRSGMSHGLANIILRRCARIGLIKAKTVDGRRLRYLLTPKGVRHVMNRSIGYVQKTLDSYRALRSGIESLVDRLAAEGQSHFLVVGEGDIVEIVADVLQSRAGLTHEILPTWNGSSGGAIDHSAHKRTLPSAHGSRLTAHGSPPTAILDCRWNGADIGVSVLHELLKKR